MNIFMSVAAIYTLALVYSYCEMPQMQDCGLMVTIAITIWWLRQVRAFCVMCACHTAGSLFLWIYEDFRPGDVSNNRTLAELLVASFVTICGLVLLR